MIDFNCFSDLFFVEKDHKYIDSKGTEFVSVTAVKKRYMSHFDLQYNLERISKRDGIPVDVLSDIWEEKRNIGIMRGDYIHRYLEGLFNRKIIARDTVLPGTVKLEQTAKELYKYLIRSGYRCIGNEIPVCYGNVAGMIDIIFEKEGNIIVGDFKTDSKTESQLVVSYGKYMKPPFDHLPESILNGYFLQVSIYMDILERNGISVHSGEIYHLHYDTQTDSATYKIYPVNRIEIPDEIYLPQN